APTAVGIEDRLPTIGTGSNAQDTFAYTPGHSRGSLTAGGATLYYLSNPAGADMEERVPESKTSWHTYLCAYGHSSPPPSSAACARNPARTSIQLVRTSCGR
ncbi:MAG: hypothetical protein ACREHV_09755, partial [Rhizomicrobium sp.]